MKPQIPPERFPPAPQRTKDASTMLSILDDLGIVAGRSVPMKPLLANWANRGGSSGSDLIAALDELAAAGEIEPLTPKSTIICRR